MMSLLEGHGDVTMDRAGVDHIPSASYFAKTLRDRRNSAKGLSRNFPKIIGLEAKLNQYQAGEAFISAVESVGVNSFKSGMGKTRKSSIHGRNPTSRSLDKQDKDEPEKTVPLELNLEAK